MHLVLFIIMCKFNFFEVIASAAPLPLLKDTQRIDITTKNGWILALNKDGSARLQFGSGPMDSAKSPEGTFLIGEVYDLLVSKLREKRADKDVAVAIQAVGETSVTAQYVKSCEVKEIFSKALMQSTALEKIRFEELLEKYPIE